MIGYLCATVLDPTEAKNHPEVKRRLGLFGAGHQGLWQFTFDPLGRGSVWATPKQESGQCLDPEDRVTFAEPEESDDGWLFYPPAVKPDPAALAKVKIPHDHINVQLSTGLYISIACATAAPKAVRFHNNAKSLSKGWHGDFARKAFDLYARVDQTTKRLKAPPQEILDVIYLGIAHCYDMTRELLSYLDWIIDTDLNDLLAAVWGVDPKGPPPGPPS